MKIKMKSSKISAKKKKNLYQGHEDSQSREKEL